MAGIEDPNVVDVVAQDVNGEYMVVMIESRRWGDDPRQPAQLRAKINAYVSFIVDGDLVRAYPEVTGQPIRMQLDCVDNPSPEVAAILARAQAELETLGVRFKLNVRG